MAETLIFHDREEFLENLRRLVREGVPADGIRAITPFAVPEVDKILPQPRSKVRYFALIGAGAGTVTGFAFTILTMTSWPIIVGGKPIVPLPPFLSIAFALTILFGSLSTFLGFLLMARLPSIRTLRSGEDYGNAFVILIEEGRRR